jgi:hypothetical protein
MGDSMDRKRDIPVILRADYVAALQQRGKRMTFNDFLKAKYGAESGGRRPADGDVGMPLLAVNADGDYAPLQMDTAGRVIMSPEAPEWAKRLEDKIDRLLALLNPNAPCRAVRSPTSEDSDFTIV